MKIKILLGILLFISVFITGYIFGIRDGVYQFQLLNGATRASLLTKELRVLRSGDGKRLIPSKEIELDGEIAAYSIMKEKGRPWIFWPQSEDFDHDRSIGYAILYRKEYPSPQNIEFISKIEGRDTREGVEEMVERVKSVVGGYVK